MKKIPPFLIYFFLFLPIAAHARENLHIFTENPLNEEEAARALDTLRKLQEKNDVITAKIFQKKTTALTEEDIETAGVITLKKPNLLYWEIVSPESSIIVVDGERLWMYNPALKEVKRQVFSKNRNARFTMKFFFSMMEMSLEKLNKRFDVSVYHPEGSYVLELRPKSRMVKKHLSVIYIWNREEDGIPVRFEVFGKKNNHTITTLQDISVNPEINDDIFQFIVPTGVRVTN